MADLSDEVIAIFNETEQGREVLEQIQAGEEVWLTKKEFSALGFGSSPTIKKVLDENRGSFPSREKVVKGRRNPLVFQLSEENLDYFFYRHKKAAEPEPKKRFVAFPFISGEKGEYPVNPGLNYGFPTFEEMMLHAYEGLDKSKVKQLWKKIAGEVMLVPGKDIVGLVKSLEPYILLTAREYSRIAERAGTSAEEVKSLLNGELKDRKEPYLLQIKQTKVPCIKAERLESLVDDISYEITTKNIFQITKGKETGEYEPKVSFKIQGEAVELEQDKKYDISYVKKILKKVHPYFGDEKTADDVALYLRTEEGMISGANFIRLLDNFNGIMLLSSNSAQKKIARALGIPPNRLDGLLEKEECSKFIHCFSRRGQEERYVLSGELRYLEGVYRGRPITES